MSAELVETLPLAQRLALSYAPGAARADALALLALDARLAGIVRSGGEAIIAQMKLAWWRDRLGQDPHDWPLGEPLLTALRDSSVETSGLLPMVDAWEILLGDTLDQTAVESFASGRAALWQVYAAPHIDAAPDGSRLIARAAREYALVDLALNLGTEAEASFVRELAQSQQWEKARLPRVMRPLVILHRLAHRAMTRGASELLDGLGAMATVMRVGFAG